ncbi:PRC-barrel domain-containing protein [Herbivorax sp. ANBcel31]|uniref:PRC-barrel domain-containing protein n=1 Tax=Herbivorax sp. ANBcel31 TaxID=3069754 RepID=UPI0027B35565|nr:PRC-barrel domain-containing protein [Herbivorax sp. ANBcel31]MDQ2085676.1 PRC-barrel domain-containing protein [Herbivorax sp. ANBcel31]
MERYSEVIGLPVICAADGKKIGVVKDIVFFPEKKKIVAFEIERNSCEIRKKLVLKEDVLNLGKDAMIIDNEKKLIGFGKAKESLGIKSKGKIIGLKIYTKYGQDVGIIKDVLFDFQKDTLDGVEVSDGLINDIVQGRNLLPLLGKVEFGKENILVEKAAVEEMMETGKGIKGIINKN